MSVGGRLIQVVGFEALSYLSVRESGEFQPPAKETDMTGPETILTDPIVSADSAVLFSAYGFGWGYCAFALPPAAVCEHLGAADATARQMLLAFELGKRRIRQVVESKALPGTGERVTLSSADFRKLN
jgi:hypothetical protein